MEIENLFKFESIVVKGRVVFKFIFREIQITELRMLKTVQLMKEVLDSFHKDEIKNVCFVFVINKMQMPTNISLFKEFASIFKSYSNVINEKLDFTIIQSNSGIFKMFFSLFKMYYEPIKPLYMCESDESTEKCLISNSERSKTATFSDILKIES